MIETALEYLNAGLSIIPVNPEDKRPLGKWKEFQTRRPTPDEATKLFTDHPGANVAVICGKVSGNLECIDFDNHDEKVADRISEFLKNEDVNKLIRNFEIPYESTPSGGYHFFYRCSTIEGNKKLAKIDRMTAVETRGEGGYVVVSPSTGYKLLFGDLSDIPTLTAEERAVLLNICRGYNDIHVDDKSAYSPVNDADRPEYDKKHGVKPGEAFCAHEDAPNAIRDLLKEAGWKFICKTGRNEQWRRPGKTNGTSASFDGEFFYCFTSNGDPFNPDKGYSLFQVFALLKHGGDFHAAARELAKMGFGSKGGGGQDQEEEEDFFIRAKFNDDGEFVKFVIDYNEYIKWLSTRGFYKYFIGQAVMLLKKTGNLLEEIQIAQISDVVKNHIKNVIKDDFMFSSLVALESALFRVEKLMFLDTLPEEFQTDDVRHAWLFFRNCAVKVGKSHNTTVYDYDELSLPVWKKSLIDRDFKPEILESDEVGEFETFVTNITGGGVRKSALMACIGYALHRYKKQSLSKALIFCDEKIPDLEEDANGGTGKSLVAKFISMYRSTVKVGSKSVDFRSPFIWQELGPETDIVLFDDVNQSFPFQMIFDVVTGDLKVERKNKTPFVIPFEQSPKFIITTNHTIKGTGVSYNRRKYELEFAPFYTEARTPRDEFGHDLFTEWGEHQQQLADAFAVKCLTLYLENGLPDNAQTITTSRIRQAIAETSRDFVDFMFTEIAEGRIVEYVEFDRKDAFERFKEVTDDTAFKMQQFTRWTTKFCQALKLKLKNRKGLNGLFTLISGDLGKLLLQYNEGTGSMLRGENSIKNADK